MGFFYHYLRSHPYVRNNLLRSVVTKAKQEHKMIRKQKPFVDDLQGYRHPLRVQNANRLRLMEEEWGRLARSQRKRRIGAHQTPTRLTYPPVQKPYTPPAVDLGRGGQQSTTVVRGSTRGFSSLAGSSQGPRNQQDQSMMRINSHITQKEGRLQPSHPDKHQSTFQCDSSPESQLPDTVRSVVDNKHHNPLNPYHIYALRYNLYSNFQRHNPVAKARDLTGAKK